MVDHPLVADNMRRYIQHHKIEESLNDGLNQVLATLPQDPVPELTRKHFEEALKHARKSVDMTVRKIFDLNNPLATRQVRPVQKKNGPNLRGTTGKFIWSHHQLAIRRRGHKQRWIHLQPGWCKR